MAENEFGFDSDDPFGVQGDESVVEQGNYKTFENGDHYRVKGIHSFIKKDPDRDLPIFVPQGDNMIARFKLIMLETRSTENQTVEVEVEGPPMSATYGQMLLLVRAFGGDISKLSPEPTTKFLLDAQEAANRGGKIRKAKVKDGWANFVEGANPPADPYTWELRGFRSPDNSTPVHFQEKEQQGKNGTFPRNFAYADFAIVANAYGLETPYKGYRLSVKINNPFDGGVAKNKSDKVIPTTKIGQQGGIPVDVKRWISLRDAFFNDFRHEWESDPERSTFGTNELENPLVVVDDHVRKNPKYAMAKLTYNQYGYPTVDVNDFIPAMHQPQASHPIKQQPTELEAFYDYVTKKHGKDIFSPTDKNADEINLDLTPKGIAWAKETLVPLWDKLELPIENGKRYIGKLSPEQLTSLTAEIRKLNGEGVNEAFIGDGAF